MTRRAAHPAQQVAVAVAAGVLAVALTIVAAPIIPRTIFVISFAAVVSAAWYGGVTAGLIAGLICVIGVDWFVLPPVGSFKFDATTDVISIAAFLGVSWLIGTMTGSLRRARDDARRVSTELEAANQLLQDQAMELELANEQLQEQATELEMANHQLQEQALELELSNEELDATARELEERRTEAEAAEQRTVEIIASVTDPLLVYDRAWRIAYLNEPARRVLAAAGVDQPDGRVIWDAMPQLRNGDVERGLREAMDSRVPSRFEWGNGRGTWVEIRTYPMGEELLVYWADITQARRERERAQLLAESSAMLTEVLAPDEAVRSMLGFVARRFADYCTLYLVDAEGLSRLADVAHRDPARAALVREMETRFPQPPDSPVGAPAVIRSGRSVLLPEITPERMRLAARSAEHLALIEQVMPISSIVVPLGARGRSFGAIIFVSAESGRRYDEQDLAFAEEIARRVALVLDNARLFAEAAHARERAEEANRGKSQFLANMSHELRTPLNAIAGHVSLMSEGLLGPLTEQQQETLSRVIRAQRHLLGLINDVLNYARLEAGRVEYRMEELAVQDVLADVLPIMQPQIEARSLVLETQIPEDRGEVPLRMRADREKTAQVLLNLLSNAAKFTPAGGRIRVTLHDGIPDRVQLSVSDTGMGIAPEQFPAIFEPFVQVGRALNRPVEGSGLGLAISRDLARGMGGDLTVESALGAGSTFTLVLPRA